MNLGDLLARWMAEHRTGRLGSLKTRAYWLASSVDLTLAKSEIGRWVRDMSALGHLEVDWDRGIWWAAPKVVTRIPTGDGLAVVCGLRTCLDDELLNQVEVEVARVDAPDGNGLARPGAVFLQFDDPQDLPEIAGAIGASYVPCAARQLARLLPRQVLGGLAAAPAHGNTTLERFSALTGTWSPVETERTDGAYRFEAMGQTKYLWLSNGEWRHADLPTCVFTALSAQGASALRWRPDPATHESGRLFVDWGAPLPPLHQRAAVLCSGRPPKFEANAKTAVYANVPFQVADDIAASLGQRLDKV